MLAGGGRGRHTAPARRAGGEEGTWGGGGHGRAAPRSGAARRRRCRRRRQTRRACFFAAFNTAATRYAPHPVGDRYMSKATGSVALLLHSGGGLSEGG